MHQSILVDQQIQVLQAVQKVQGIQELREVLSILQDQVLQVLQLILVVQQDRHCPDFRQVPGNQGHLCKNIQFV